MNGITIIDIAKLANVSVSTVSRVMNNHPDVSAKTRAKVMEVIEAQSYIPNDSARSLKRESMKAIAVVVKGFANPFFISMLSVIQQELEKSGYMMMLQQVDTNQNEVTSAISLCKEKKPQGLIFMGGNFKHRRNQLAMLDVPYVMLTIAPRSSADRTLFSSVAIDDFAAGRSVACRMIESGHTLLAAIGAKADDISVSRLRIDGFRQCIQDKGLYTGEEQVAYTGEFTRKAGYEATKTLLKQAKFTALFCISDIMALGAIRAIHDAGLKVPQDISVVGFDGIDEGRYSIPSLATMKQPGTDMAHKSVQVLLGNIRSGKPHKHYVFEAEFSPGESFVPAE